MPLHANEIFFAPPHERRASERALTVLGRVRFARLSSFLTFAAMQGLPHDAVDRWHSGGLIHRGLFRENPIEGTDETFVTLTSRGAKELALATGLTVEGISPARLKVSSQKRAHDVGVGEVALAVLSAAEDGRLHLLGLETDDRKLVSTVTITDSKRGARNIGLQPDALVMVRGPKGPCALAIELDRGTTSVKRMQAKYAAYLTWREHNGPERDYSLRSFRVVTIVPDARRLEKLHAAALAASGGKPSGFLLFALSEHFTVRDRDRLFDPIARRLAAREEALIPLFESEPADVSVTRAAA